MAKTTISTLTLLQIEAFRIGCKIGDLAARQALVNDCNTASDWIMKHGGTGPVYSGKGDATNMRPRCKAASRVVAAINAQADTNQAEHETAVLSEEKAESCAVLDAEHASEMHHKYSDNPPKLGRATHDPAVPLDSMPRRRSLHLGGNASPSKAQRMAGAS